MEVRTGFMQTELGVIPKDWQITKVGEVCGCIVPGRNKPKLFDGDIPWITTPDLEDGEPITTSRDGLCISRAEAKAVGSKVVPPGSVLMSCAGELGIVALTQNEIVVNQQLHVFIPGERIDAMFLLSALSYQKDQIANYGTKTAVPYLNKNSCNSIPIPLPTLGEQRAIATALSDVDALLGGLDRLIAKKRDLKQAAMQQLLTGKTRLPGFDGEWEAVEFGDVASIRNAKVTPAGTQCVELESISQGSGQLFRTTDATGLSSKYSFKKGDVLFGRLRAYLRKYWLASFDGVCSTEIWPLIARDGRLCGDFLHLLVQTNDFVNAAGVSYGTHMPRSDWSVLKRFPVRLPRRPEQSAIAAVLSDIDGELSALVARRDKTGNLKQAMMQELLTGKTRLVPAGATHA
jgi:type I restriction enzyme, S subunit